jgi:hypothetical protein
MAKKNIERKTRYPPFGLFNKVIVYFKDERSSSSTLIIALTNLVSCFVIQSTCRSCFGHSMSKVAQYYAIDDSKVYTQGF